MCHLRDARNSMVSLRKFEIFCIYPATLASSGSWFELPSVQPHRHLIHFVSFCFRSGKLQIIWMWEAPSGISMSTTPRRKHELFHDSDPLSNCWQYETLLLRFHHSLSPCFSPNIATKRSYHHVTTHHPSLIHHPSSCPAGWEPSQGPGVFGYWH